jgi:hypothetical protein
MSRINEIRKRVVAVCENAENYWTGEDTENQQRLRREVAHDLKQHIEKVFATAPTETSKRCWECLNCGHNAMDGDGFCTELVLGPVPLAGLRYCGCKCVFPASTEVAGEQKGKES